MSISPSDSDSDDALDLDPPAAPSWEEAVNAWAAEAIEDPEENRAEAARRIRTWAQQNDAQQPLNLDNLGLTRLPDILPQTLTMLYANNNRLREVPDALPQGLRRLFVRNNQITRLSDTLPEDLARLFVGNNQLTRLPDTLPEDLLELEATHNQLTQLSVDLLSRFSDDCNIDLDDNPLPEQVRNNLAAVINARGYAGPRVSFLPPEEDQDLAPALDAPLPIALSTLPVPVVAGVPFYQEDQVALGALRRELGDTCPSHALNAVLGGAATSYERQEAVTLEEFDLMVEALGLPAPGWRDYGADFLPPADLESLIGPRRAVLQINHLDPATGVAGAHFLALRGDGAEPGWRAIDSMQQEQAGQSRQPIVGTTLTEALNHYLAQPDTQVSVGTWLPGTVLPEVGGAAQMAMPLSEPLDAFARWLASGRLARLERMATQGTIPEYLIGQFLGSDAAARIEEQDLRRDVQALVERLGPPRPAAASRPQPDNSPVSDAELAEAINNEQMADLHSLHMGVTNAQWRRHADAVLTQLPRLPQLDQRRDIATAVTEALFEEDAELVNLIGMESAQEGRHLAALAFASLMDPSMDLNDDRFAPFMTRLQSLSDGTSRSTLVRDAAQHLLRLLYPEIAGLAETRGTGGLQNSMRSALGFGSEGAAPETHQASTGQRRRGDPLERPADEVQRRR